jgi:hypothetical protein
MWGHLSGHVRTRVDTPGRVWTLRHESATTPSRDTLCTRFDAPVHSSAVFLSLGAMLSGPNRGIRCPSFARGRQMDQRNNRLYAALGVIAVGVLGFLSQNLPSFIWKVSEKVAVDATAKAASKAIDRFNGGEAAVAEALAPRAASASSPITPWSPPAADAPSPIDTGSIMEQPNHSSIATYRAPAAKKSPDDDLPLPRLRKWLFGDERRQSPR